MWTVPSPGNSASRTQAQAVTTGRSSCVATKNPLGRNSRREVSSSRQRSSVHLEPMEWFMISAHGASSPGWYDRRR